MKYKLIPITSLDQLKVGDVIQADDYARKILDKTTHLVALSDEYDLESFGFQLALHNLIKCEFQLQVPDEPWRPKEGQKYYFPLTFCGVAHTNFTDFVPHNSTDQARLAAGMCFQTEAEALVAAQKMLDVLKPQNND